MIDEPFSWGTFSGEFADALAGRIGGRRVLEVFAGNGLLASLLASRGVDIVATSLFSGHDAHDRGMFHPVVESGAVDAARTLGVDRDVLLMSWPVADDSAFLAALAWGAGRPILYVGEAPGRGPDEGALSGCASDEFFASTRLVAPIPSYRPRSPIEVAEELELDPAAAAVQARMLREVRSSAFGRLR